MIMPWSGKNKGGGLMAMLPAFGASGGGGGGGMDWGSIIAGGGALAGGILSNNANRDISRDQMAFQREMSNTAHRREVDDLRKAGLNPILSATGGQGASTPQGSQATMQNVGSAAVSSALEARRVSQQNTAIQSQVSLNQANTLGAQATALKDTNTAQNVNLQNKLLKNTMGAKAAITNAEGKGADLIIKGINGLSNSAAKVGETLGTANPSWNRHKNYNYNKGNLP